MALVFPTFGPMGVYHLQKKLLRREVKKQLLSAVGYEELACFEATRLLAEDVRWVDDGEFVMDGLYFDVVERVNTDSGTMVYCWPDHKESELERVRSAVAANWLSDRQGKEPIGFLSYLIFIKGFYKTFEKDYFLMRLTQKGVFEYFSPIGSDIEISVFRPPEQGGIFRMYLLQQ